VSGPYGYNVWWSDNTGHHTVGFDPNNHRQPVGWLLSHGVPFYHALAAVENAHRYNPDGTVIGAMCRGKDGTLYTVTRF
jgi:hypothetical protein